MKAPVKQPSHSIERIIIGVFQKMASSSPDDQPASRGRPRFACGAHSDRFGFWAVFYWEDAEALASIRTSAGRYAGMQYPATHTEPNCLDCWYDVGHGFTMKQAVVEAERLVFGEIEQSRWHPKQYLQANMMQAKAGQDLRFADTKSARFGGPTRFSGVNGSHA